MEVQAAAAAATAPQSGQVSAAPQPNSAAPAVHIGAGPALPSNASQTDGASLSPIVAKLLAHGALPAPVNVNVSYRVEHDPNMVVTVFTDPQTGVEIAQVPAEVMVQFAQFFDKHSGVTLDRSA